jgi:hypothetical protein
MDINLEKLTKRISEIKENREKIKKYSNMQEITGKISINFWNRLMAILELNNNWEKNHLFSEKGPGKVDNGETDNQ